MSWTFLFVRTRKFMAWHGTLVQPANTAGGCFSCAANDRPSRFQGEKFCDWCNQWKIAIFNCKSTISMGIFNSYVKLPEGNRTIYPKWIAGTNESGGELIWLVVSKGRSLDNTIDISPIYHSWLVVFKHDFYSPPARWGLLDFIRVVLLLY